MLLVILYAFSNKKEQHPLIDSLATPAITNTSIKAISGRVDMKGI
ncbi:hypothetical protein [Tepidanaerobacter syntrophicus]|uniref:Uncharacterized protein n=1 Tax=Tepidanaerobacter syntrophicus TaxID=224999 RepID=A0A0U9HSJ0_9FIRM|nr:hypothetical protein [Tepidanaerobacter syntrophicus]GAQ26039.1 hypothetical protein TSYNT_9295 [Tepidanaerobacter syntrophicus]